MENTILRMMHLHFEVWSYVYVQKKRQKKKKKHWNWYKFNVTKSDLKLICYQKYKIQTKCQRLNRSLKSKDIIYLLNHDIVRSGTPQELSA